MTEEQILDLCKRPYEKKYFYWSAEIYGLGLMIRKYGFYPKSLPLNIYASHGVRCHDLPAPHELSNTAPAMLYFSPRLVQEYKKISPKPCYCLISPNVFYRKVYNIKRDPLANGTLAFLSHTAKGVENNMDFEKYILQLKSLEAKFHPISVCVHHVDVHKGIYKPFMNAGINVVTLGDAYRLDFIKRFYDLIRSFRYLTSNEIGSYTYYGPEMGIPFFLYGNEPEYFNTGDPNVETGIYTSFRQTNHYQVVKKLFQEPTDFVTDEQKALVNFELGVNDTISRLRLSFILYSTYWQYISPKLKKRLYKMLRVSKIKAIKTRLGI